MSRTLKFRQDTIFTDDEGVTRGGDPIEDTVEFDSFVEGGLFWAVENTDTLHVSFPNYPVAIEIHNTSATEELIVAWNCGDNVSLGPGDRDRKLVKTAPTADTPYFRVEAYPLNTPATEITLAYRYFTRTS